MTLAPGIGANTAIFSVRYTIVATCLALTGLIVCAVPALQAARLDPTHALREE